MHLISLKKLISFFKKLYYYRSIFLFFHIIKTLFKVTKATSKLKIIEIDYKRKNITSVKQKEKIRKYVALFFYLKAKLKLYDTCLVKSLVLCKLYREIGLDAKINFGTKKAEDHINSDWKTVGHCWVSTPKQDIAANYPFIFQYP